MNPEAPKPLGKIARRAATLLLMAGLVYNAGCGGQESTNSGNQPDLLPTPTLAPMSLYVEALQTIRENATGTISMNNQQTFHYEYELDGVRLPNEGSVYLSKGIFFDGEHGVSAASAITEGGVMTQILERAGEHPALGRLYDKLVFGGTATIFPDDTLSPEMLNALLGQDSLYVSTNPLPTIYDENGNPIKEILQSVVYDNDGKPFLTVRFRPTNNPNEFNRFDILDIQVFSPQSRGATNKITTKPKGQHSIRGKRRRPATTAKEREVQWWFQEGYQSRTRVLGEPLMEAFSQYIEGDGITVAQAERWAEQLKAQRQKTRHTSALNEGGASNHPHRTHRHQRRG